MYSRDFVVQQTVLMEQELLRLKILYGDKYGNAWLDGAMIFVKELLPLIILKQENEEMQKAMIDGVKFIANHTAWLLELQAKDWKNAKG